MVSSSQDLLELEFTFPIDLYIDDSATHHSFNRILFSCFSFTWYSNSFFIRLLTSRIVRPDIPCSFTFSSNSLIEISFLSASSSLINFAPTQQKAIRMACTSSLHLDISQTVPALIIQIQSPIFLSGISHVLVFEVDEFTILCKKFFLFF